MNRKSQEMLMKLAAAKSFDEIGGAVAVGLTEIFNAELCTIWRVYEDRGDGKENKRWLRLLATSARTAKELAEDIQYEIGMDRSGVGSDGVTGFVAQTQQVVMVDSWEELTSRYKFCWRGLMDKIVWYDKPGQHFRSLLAVPLVLGDRVVGVVKLENKRNAPNGFSDKDCSNLRSLAQNHIATVAHTFALHEANTSPELIDATQRLVEPLLDHSDGTVQISRIVKVCAEVLRAEISSLWLLDEDGRQLRLADSFGFEYSAEQRAKHTYSLPRNWDSDDNLPDECIEGITAWVAIRKRPFSASSWSALRNHPSHKGVWDAPMWVNRGQRFRCLVAVPLMYGTTVRGVLKVENRIGAPDFSSAEQTLCQIIASLIVLAIELGKRVDVSRLEKLLLQSSVVHEIKNYLPKVSAAIDSTHSHLARHLVDELAVVAEALYTIGEAIEPPQSDQHGAVISCALEACKRRAEHMHDAHLTELYGDIELAQARLMDSVEFALPKPPPRLNDLSPPARRMYVVMSNLIYDAWRFSGVDWLDESGDPTFLARNTFLSLETVDGGIKIVTGARMPATTFDRSFRWVDNAPTGFVTPRTRDVTHPQARIMLLHGSQLSQMIARQIGFVIRIMQHDRCPGLVLLCEKETTGDVL